MAQDQQANTPQQKHQLYDSTFKDWVSQQAPIILPVLLPGALYEATLDSELVLPTRRVDKVFKVLYHGEEHVLHLEFQSGYDDQLKSRLLVYNAVLYHKHGLPVLTIVVYPFSTTVAKQPLCILSQDKPLLTFLFKTLPLFRLDAEEIVRQHQACLYPLLPTMKNVDANLIAQVMQELIELYRDDETTLAQQYVWIQILLERTTTITAVKKEEIKARLTMFEQLFDESPMIQKMREQSRMQGLEQGLEQGLQHALVNVIRTKYPDLAELAQQQASHFDKPDVLDLLIQQVVTAPNASAARKLLELGPQ